MVVLFLEINMIVYPLSRTERRTINCMVVGTYAVSTAFMMCLICDLIDWLEGLVPLIQIGIFA